jgi:hypothetical protein
MDNNMEIQTMVENFHFSLDDGSKQNINMGQPQEKILHRTLNLPLVSTEERNHGTPPKSLPIQ